MKTILTRGITIAGSIPAIYLLNKISPVHGGTNIDHIENITINNINVIDSKAVLLVGIGYAIYCEKEKIMSYISSYMIGDEAPEPIVDIANGIVGHENLERDTETKIEIC